MKHRSIKVFLLKVILLSCPFLLLFAYYIIRDPFMVLRSYSDYDHSPISQNEGYVSWQKYKLYRNKAHYDSFIMGNSCTMGFACTDWNRHIKAHPYRMFCNGMQAIEIIQVLKKFDNIHQEVKNLLLVMNGFSFSDPYPSTSPMRILPPEVSGKSWISVQTALAQAFFEPKVLFPYLRYTLLGTVNKASKGVINTTFPARSTYTNDANLTEVDSIMQAQGTEYWQGRKWDECRKAMPTVDKRQLKAPQIAMLKTIKAFCDKHHTRLKVVIVPNAMKTKANPADLRIMQNILGREAVFDFTGRADYYDYHNFYDDSHFGKQLGRKMMEEMYR